MDYNVTEMIYQENTNDSDTGAIVPKTFSEGTPAIPCITLVLGVIGNSLAIGSLVKYKYKKIRPQSSIHLPSSRTPSPSLRKNCSTGNIPMRDGRRTWSIGSKIDINIFKTTKKRRRKHDFGVFHTLVLALLSVDLAGILVTSPVTMYLYSTNQGIKEAGGESLCNYSAFAMMFFGIVTTAALTAMAIERVLSIQFPFYYERAIRPKTANIAIIILLLASTLFCSLPTIGFGAVRQMHPNTWCFADWHTTEPKDMAFNFLYAVIGILLIMTTVLCNISAVVGLFKMKKKRTFKRSWSMETQTIIQLIVMTCIYIVCWLPIMIRIIINQVTLETNGTHDRLAVWLAATNPVVDPWVYILLRRTVVRRMIGITKSKLCIARNHTQRDSKANIIVTPADESFQESPEQKCPAPMTYLATDNSTKPLFKDKCRHTKSHQTTINYNNNKEQSKIETSSRRYSC